MMLYNRIIREGTINAPKGHSEPEFALPSTVNWMRALAILLKHNNLNFDNACVFYNQQVRRPTITPFHENTVMEQLFLGLHHLSALEKLKDQKPCADYARIGILAWYYGITNAASAMTAAKDGSFQEDHAGTARKWDENFAATGLAMEPFNWRVSSLVEKTYKSEVDKYRAGNSAKLRHIPTTPTGALGAAAGYLSGSANWYAEKKIKEIRGSNEFRILNVNNFRTKKAQELRDSKLSDRSIGFIHLASRYRGKANYREALFLAYGKTTEATLGSFIEDQAEVLRGFLAMAGAFVSRKLGPALWADFVADVDANRAFSTSAASVWS